jgi:hypothetical protein
MFAILILAIATTIVSARAHSAFAGQVVLLDRIPPSYFNTQNGFINFLRKHKQKILHANEDNEWMFRSMAFFRKPLGDYEVEMVFYDVGQGTAKSIREFKDSFTQYTQDRQAKSLLGRATLTRPIFDANKKYVVEVQSRGKTVATGSFETRGISQQQLDQQKRIETERKKMEKSMEELRKKAEQQEQQEQQKKDAEAGKNLF